MLLLCGKGQGDRLLVGLFVLIAAFAVSFVPRHRHSALSGRPAEALMAGQWEFVLAASGRAHRP